MNNSPLSPSGSDQRESNLSYPRSYRKVGNLLFLSGVGPNTKLANAGTDAPLATPDFAAQCDAAFAALDSVLIFAGSSRAEVVDVTAFLTDIAGDYEIFCSKWATFFTGLELEPCCTAVQVAALINGNAIELKAIATVV